jgi:hypothetical protein
VAPLPQPAALSGMPQNKFSEILILVKVLVRLEGERDGMKTLPWH